ncbi:FadR family transcriptional regulator [Nocardioides sp. BGMRC 2183]|nr:FadR family transcriptional regulator [Nocardioides sp. BGMRC 2183]
MRVLSGDARTALFAPLDDGWGRSEAVARRLGGAIALGLIEDGEQLPPEQELATSLNVSTLTLREALADLRSKGLVETRRGRTGGSFVRVSESALAGLSRARLAQVGVSDLRELGDLHATIAGSAARLAAERASPTEIGRLRDLARRLASVRNESELRRVDGRFLIELAASAQSVRLTMLEIELQGEMAQLAWLRPRHRPEELSALRLAVAEAVARRRATRARRLVEDEVAATTRLLIDDHIALTLTPVDRGEADG